MPRYLVTYQTHASAVVEVDADGPQEALDASWDQLPGGLCHQCARGVTLGDFEPINDAEAGDLAAVEEIGHGRHG